MNGRASGRALTLLGMDAHAVGITVEALPGSGTFELAGVRESAIRESRIRVRAALQQLPLDLKGFDIAVSLKSWAPEVSGDSLSRLDAQLASLILLALGRIPTDRISETVVLGELALSGAMRPIRGALPLLRAIAGGALPGIKRAIVPRENAREAALVRGLPVLLAEDLAGVAAYFAGEADLELAPSTPFTPGAVPGKIDLSDVRGHHSARRALEIAAAGGHDLLILGQPGSGKTMLARRLPTILPPPSVEEALEVTSIHSVAGLIAAEQGMIAWRPFRAPHHTVSEAGLVGGGDPVRPGEVSLAHGGVLFVDEIQEFARSVLDALSVAIREGRATTPRRGERVSFPAAPLVVGATLPCPCGYAGDRRRCKCSPERIGDFRKRIMDRPLADRFDLRVVLPPVDVQALQGTERGESSERVRSRVVAARKRQEVRGCVNARLSGEALQEHAAWQLDRHAAAGLAAAIKDVWGTTSFAPLRARILRVARTIADLDESDLIRAGHVAEAVAGAKVL